MTDDGQEKQGGERDYPAAFLGRVMLRHYTVNILSTEGFIFSISFSFVSGGNCSRNLHLKRKKMKRLNKLHKHNTVDLVIFACSNLHEYVILGLFVKSWIRNLSISMIGSAIIMIIFARFLNSRIYPKLTKTFKRISNWKNSSGLYNKYSALHGLKG